LSLERQETLKRQLLVESTAEEILGESGVHGLKSVTSDGVITMSHANTALNPQHITHLFTTVSLTTASFSASTLLVQQQERASDIKNLLQILRAFRVKLGANDLNCVDVPLNPTHSLCQGLSTTPDNRAS